MNNMLLIFVGGGLGALLRYWGSGIVYRLTSLGFPYGTAVVNITGCFVIGLVMSGLAARFDDAPGLKLFLTIGLLGGFTTYSSFSYETIALIQEAKVAAAMTNIGVTLVGCLAGTWIGLGVGRVLG